MEISKLIVRRQCDAIHEFTFFSPFRKEMGKQLIFTIKNHRLTHNYYAHLAGLVKLGLKIVSPFDRIFFFRYPKMVS